MDVDLPPNAPQPRNCHLVKWPDFNGYGFNLHSAKGQNPGQLIGQVEADSPASSAGLKQNDRIIEVNGVNISNENHRQVVQRIQAIPNETVLLVVDEEADEWYKSRGIVVSSDLPNVVNLKTHDKFEIRENGHHGSEEDDESIGDRGGSISSDDQIRVTPSPLGLKEDMRRSSDEGLPETMEALTVEEKTSRGSSMGMSAAHEAIVATMNQSNGTIEPPRQPPSPLSSRGSSRASPKPEPVTTPPVEVRAPPSPVVTETPAFARTVTPDGLNLGMSAKEMRERLKAKGKYDPKKEQMDIMKKHEIIASLGSNRRK
ncbi:unnamed protein product [Cyprideis torosa]|uniref:Uncharacterized protein n=1 Tax=Cyprideis torosa TaxID=163714 RepID=A0A7R8W367_9CRUS|nr:unnamed protein product [Cyprideis torosa]CAG0879343.1 unnamed protein product [Cyprideis torosa]